MHNSIQRMADAIRALLLEEGYVLVEEPRVSTEETALEMEPVEVGEVLV